MKQPQSSKKIYFFVVVFVLLGGIFIGSYFVLKSRTAFTENTETNQTTENLNQTTIINLENDSDKDGLEDWQEILFGTDKNNPDTDNDGYLDGEEVLSGHNPLKPAPDDIIIKTAEGDSRNKDNLTQYFAQQLAQQMSSLNPDPNTESLLKVSAQDILDNLSSKELNEIGSISSGLIPELIKEEDLKITKATKQSVLDYLKQIEAALKKNENTYEDVNTFKNVLQTGDFSKIRQIITTYQNNHQDIRVLTVPSGFAALHIELLNILALTKTSLENFSLLSDDPVKAYLGLEMYKQAYSLLPGFSQKLIDQLALIYK